MLKIRLIEILGRIRETCTDPDEIEAMDEAIHLIRWIQWAPRREKDDLRYDRQI